VDRSRHHSFSRRAFLQGAGAALLPALGCRAAAPGAAAPGDWPCFRGPNRNGVLDQGLTLLPGGPRKLWEVGVGNGNASMAIVQGRLYTFGTGNDNLVCLNVGTGNPVWKRSLETHFGDCTPSVEGGRVYAMPSLAGGPNLGHGGIPTTYCCDAATGNILWKRDLPGSTGDRQYGHAGSPLLWEDLVILNAAAGAALKKSTGEVAWLHPGFPGLATPVLFQAQGRPCVALFGGDRLIAREARSGKELWQIPWKTELAVNACDPVLFDNKVFICSDYGRGRALYDISGAQPRVLWEFGQGRGSSFSSGFYRDGHLFCFAQGKFACLDVRTGQPRWETEGGNAALLIGGTLILIHHAGEMRFGRISPTAYQPLAAADAGLRDIKAVPAYWNGRLYVRNETGRIACFQIGTAG
jgi:outer membrane protein assembly factor BamB